LGAESVNHAVAYLLSIRDTNVEGKEAQGELYAPDGAAPDSDAEEAAPATDDAGTAGSDATTPESTEAAEAEGQGAPAVESSGDVPDSEGESATAPASE
jgi:hypothetical protein